MLAPGARLGPFESLAFLAAGGMGEVYRARDSRLGREVALKILPPDKVADPDRRERFIREARAASKLNHPNIVTIHDIAEIDGVHFIVMEYVPGKALTRCIPLEAGRAIRVASQIAAALAIAHGAGITHRDLKPSNVMLTEEGVVKVLDFGLAKLDESLITSDGDTRTMSLTQTGTILGTPAYMSPEQIEGGMVGPRSDIFSFGLLLYEVLAGRHAFSAGTPGAMMAAILSKQPSPLGEIAPHVSPALERIVMRCLERDPSMRFQSMIDVKLALGSVVAGGAGAPPSIAVLPFVNMSSDADNEYFSDGLTEEVIRLLGQIPDLRVTARTSSFSFRGKDTPADAIARSLHVDHLLEGSVRKAGNRIRVTAQLIKASDGFQLWSERFDGDLTDVFTVQDEIAEGIARRLKSKFATAVADVRSMRHNPSVDAYNACLKGRYHLYKYTRADMAIAKECFASAISLDPGYAAAYSGMAMYCMSTLDVREMVRGYSTKVQPLLEKALELDPELSEAHALRGTLLATLEYDWPAAEREFQQALTAPSVPADVYFHYGLDLLLPLGRFPEALQAFGKAKELDPLVPMYMKAPVYSCTGEYQKVIDECRAALELDAQFWPAQVQGACALFELGKFDEALATFESLRPRLGAESWIVLHGIGGCLFASGRQEEAREILGGMIRRNAAPWDLGLMCHLVGDVEAGFEWMNRAVEDRDPRMFSFVRLYRFSTGLKEHPQFQALLRRMNLEPVV